MCRSARYCSASSPAGATRLTRWLSTSSVATALRRRGAGNSPPPAWRVAEWTDAQWRRRSGAVARVRADARWGEARLGGGAATGGSEDGDGVDVAVEPARARAGHAARARAELARVPSRTCSSRHKIADVRARSVRYPAREIEGVWQQTRVRHRYGRHACHDGGRHPDQSPAQSERSRGAAGEASARSGPLRCRRRACGRTPAWRYEWLGRRFRGLRAASGRHIRSGDSGRTPCSRCAGCRPRIAGDTAQGLVGEETRVLRPGHSEPSPHVVPRCRRRHRRDRAQHPYALFQLA